LLQNISSSSSSARLLADTTVTKNDLVYEDLSTVNHKMTNGLDTALDSLNFYAFPNDNP